RNPLTMTSRRLAPRQLLLLLAALLPWLSPLNAQTGDRNTTAFCPASAIELSIPYIWTINPSGREADALSSSVDDELRSALLDGLPVSNWEALSERLSVQKVRLTGYASPETSSGPNSIRPENENDANVRLAKRRAEALKDALANTLEPFGLEADAITVAGAERQFTSEEWQALHQVATGKESAGIIDVPAVYRLLVRLNAQPDSFEAAQLSALQQVLADKKSVDIVICYELATAEPSAVPAEDEAQNSAQKTVQNTDAPAETAIDPESTTDITNTTEATSPQSENLAKPAEIEPDAAPTPRPTLQRTPLKGATDTPPSPRQVTQPTEVTDYGLGPFIEDLLEGDFHSITEQLTRHIWLLLGITLGVVLLILLLIKLTDLLSNSAPPSHKARSHRRRAWSASGPRMLAIMSGKGGTGKSSISSSLAYGLAHLGYKTLLVDVDLFTHGLTVLNQPSLDRSAECVPLKAVFDPVAEGQTPPVPTPVAIETKFTGANLFVLPSIPVSDVDLDSMPVAAFEPLELPAPHNETKPFAEQLKRSLEQVCKDHSFDYVVLDTRGGADHTSVGAALAATAFVLITEADKPSWAISDRLLDTVYAVRKEVDMKTRPLGFVINKNALPADEIEEHLKDRWEMKHLGTLPYDPTVVRCFEKARIPLDMDSSAPFSEGVFALLRRLDHARIWD
ncbi:MAG: P-loop NTPase, partial [Gammaproteobacteria bacterium]